MLKVTNEDIDKELYVENQFIQLMNELNFELCVYSLEHADLTDSLYLNSNYSFIAKHCHLIACGVCHMIVQFLLCNIVMYYFPPYI